MPSQSVTVILNFDQSKKFALLGTAANRRKDSILQDARNKFRVKGLSSVFLQGGDLLEEGVELPEVNTRIWIGKGEPYSGPPPDLSQNLHPGLVRIIAEKSYVDPEGVKQLKVVSSLDGVRLAVGMPDLHPGNRFPIGCAIAAEGIYPALIGSDVGCGIALYDLPASSRSITNPKKVANMLRGLDEPWAGSVSEWLSKYGILRTSPFDKTSLGTVGAGNHFAEICTPERIIDEAAAASLNIAEGSLYLLVHTGSRGLGASILARETTTTSNPYIPPDSAHLSEYLVEHDYAVTWAMANRDLVAHRIKECFHPNAPSWKSEGNETSDSPSERLVEIPSLEKIIDVTHNSVTQHVVSIGGNTVELWVHRKGAAPADKGFVPCPGSRGDFTWILQPKGDGQHNALSLAHGAGRRYARNALHTVSKIDKSSLTTTSLGSEVVCTDADLLIEERPEAYKSVESVVEDMEDLSLCKGIVVFRPIVTYKVREAREGRK